LSEEDLKARVLSALDTRGLTFEELALKLSWTGDRRPLRRALAELVRDGRVLRVPDYERRRMVFALRSQ
jgi:hypothetical protein